jgi:hypothetical protein
MLLSNTSEGEFLLDGNRFDAGHPTRILQPHPYVAIRKEGKPQQGDQRGQGPTDPAFELQELDQQHRNLCCPNLRLERIGTGADEGLDPQVLLDRLEKQLDLPALFVDGGNRRGAQDEVVGPEDYIATSFPGHGIVA